jgi:hypothetical protein
MTKRFMTLPRGFIVRSERNGAWTILHEAAALLGVAFEATTNAPRPTGRGRNERGASPNAEAPRRVPLELLETRYATIPADDSLERR